MVYPSKTSLCACDRRAKAQAAATGALKRRRVTERSYPTFEVRGRSWEEPMPEGPRPRGVTQCRRSGEVAERRYPASEVRGRSWEDPMPKGQWPRGATPSPRSGEVAKRRYPASEVRGRDKRSYPASEVRGCSREEIPHSLKPESRGSVEGATPCPHAQGQGQWPGGPTPGCGCAGQEGLEELSDVEGQEGQR